MIAFLLNLFRSLIAVRILSSRITKILFYFIHFLVYLTLTYLHIALAFILYAFYLFCKVRLETEFRNRNSINGAMVEVEIRASVWRESEEEMKLKNLFLLTGTSAGFLYFSVIVIAEVISNG